MTIVTLPRSIPHVVLVGAERTGEKIAVVDGERRVSYQQLADLMRRSAGAFHRAGLSAGERVAIWAPNSLEFIVATLAVQSLGGCIVPLNTRFKGAEVEYIINRSQARFLVVVDRFLGSSYPEVIEKLDLPHLQRTIKLPSTESDCADWASFLTSATPESIIQADAVRDGLTGSEVSDVMFTSGTTGSPKGVMTNHAQNIQVYATWVRMNTLTADDRYLMVYPYFHCSGYKAGWLSCFIAGATAYPLAHLDVPALAELVRRERITFMPGPPTLFQTLLSAAPEERGDLSSIRVAQTGATSVPPAVIDRMKSELLIQSVMTGYGLTETCGTVTLTAPGDGVEVITRSCGRAIEGIELRVVDADNQPLPIGREGEVCVRGYNVMLGYFNDPQSTAKAIDADGWLHTGDIGLFDEAGYLRLTDRKNDMFIVGGFNCYPAEIEKLMCGNSDYVQVAVIGVPDERMGEVGKAFVVPRQGAKVTPQNVIAWCRENMANYKVPRYVAVVNALPMNSVGKVLKFQLR